MEGQKNKKLYLVGIDSTPLWLIEKLSKKGKMKGFELFLKEKMLMEIESTVPPVTSAAWPTIYTGLEPKDHGIIDFSGIDKNYEKQLLYYDSTKNPPFWDVLASKGLDCLVVTPAVALERSKFKNVDMVTGWPLQPRYSSANVEEIAKRFEFDGEPDIGNALNTGKMQLEDATRLYTESTKKRADLSKYLIERKNYDMVFVCFTETDRIQHYSLNLKNWEAYVSPIYEEISDFILYLRSRIEKLNEEAMLMIVSDHGAQPIHHKFLSNSWIVQNNYGTLKEAVYNRDVAKVEKGTLSKARKKLVDTVVESKFRREIYSKMPRSLKKVAESFVEESFDYESQGKYIRIRESDFKMEETKAFCSVAFGPMGMIWINDSRFSKPCVKKTEKEKLKKEISSNLMGIEELDGGKLIKAVYEGSEFFTEKKNLIIPDLVFELEQGYTADFSGYLKKGLYTEPEINRRGEHTRLGILGIQSYNSRISLKGLKESELKLFNISPTILKYFGVDSAAKSRSLI